MKLPTPTFFRKNVSGRSEKVIWLILPTLAVLTFLFLGGFIFGFLQSLGFFSVLSDRKEQIGLSAYRMAFSSRPVRAGILLTFRVAFLSTIISLVVALALSLMISRTKRMKSFMISLVQFNIPIPHVVAATGILLTFSQSGIISRITYSLGMHHSTGDFPIITNDPFGYGIILSYLWKEIPFLTVLILSALRGYVTLLDEAAKTLGAKYSYRLKRIILPYVFPSILSGTIIVFAFSFGSYEVPYILGQPYPATLPVVAYQFYTNRDLSFRPVSMALATVTSLVIAILVYFYMKLTQRERKGI